MPRICISYRRSDQGITGRIFDRLSDHYGKPSVFMDVAKLPPGTDFRHFFNARLLDSDVLLVIIGKKWVGQAKGSKGRIYDESDPVRVELEIALENKKPIIPILVDGAKMPRESQMPLSLQNFLFIHALAVNSGADFDHHMERLLETIDETIPKRRPRPEEQHSLGHVTLRAKDGDLNVEFNIAVYDRMTFQAFLDAAYWQLNANDILIDEYTYGKAWILVDGHTGTGYLKVKPPRGEDIRVDDVRLLDEVGITPGQILDFTRL